MRNVFISDLHLAEERPNITRALFSFIEEQCLHSKEKTHALYILGDLFETWIGDDDNSELALSVKSALRELTDAGINVFFMHGNRDFLVGPSFCKDTNATLLSSDTHNLKLQGKQAIIMHGDTLCTQDTEYLAFRNMVRDPGWQAGFLSKSTIERTEIAKQIRQQSKQSASEKSEYIMDVDEHAVEDALRLNNADILIHGHTHRPNTHAINLPNKPIRYVLGDWDELGWSLISDSSGIHLTSFAIID
ncbi:UDP-2,3-diacylglucosamine diphosphatase [Gammaproteobacteria bacterium 45_16_T64]|nr:UDP-2,3-diacylglucosamine diphosphatase [Gammaproteobacteria bacterium 45_16_T64]